MNGETNTEHCKEFSNGKFEISYIRKDKYRYFTKLTFLFITLISFGILSGCSSSTDEVYYAEFPDVLDFGELSGVIPEIDDEQSDGTVTYIYYLGDDGDGKSSLDRFNKNLENKDYVNVIERNLADNGLIYSVYQNDIYQVMTGESFEGQNDAIVHIAIRERYYRYTGYPTVPDYGAMNDIEPSKVSIEKDDTGRDVTVNIYNDSMNADEYVKVLLNHEFSVLEERMSYEDGYITVYCNEEYYVVVGTFPTLTLVTIGSL